MSQKNTESTLILKHRTGIIGVTLAAGLFAGVTGAHAQFGEQQQQQQQHQPPREQAPSERGEQEFVFPGHDDQGQSKDPAARMEELRQEYEQLSEHLADVHREAMADDDLEKSINDL